MISIMIQLLQLYSYLVMVIIIIQLLQLNLVMYVVMIILLLLLNLIDVELINIYCQTPIYSPSTTMYAAGIFVFQNIFGFTRCKFK